MNEETNINAVATVQEKGAAVSKQSKDAVATLFDRMQGEWAKVLPKAITPERFARVALSMVRRNPKLGEALMTEQGKLSLLDKLMSCAAMGMEPDGKLVHLIPYKNEIQLIVDYKGLYQLVMNTGLVSLIHADKVCENDVFKVVNGRVHHEPNILGERGAVKAYYALCEFKDGGQKSEVMTVAEIESVRGRSRAGQSGPWVTDFDEMAKKGLWVETPIPTVNGMKHIVDLRPGDVVFDMYGKKCIVNSISDVKNVPCYKITFSNGDEVVCDNEHYWVALTGSNASAKLKRKGWDCIQIEDLFKAFNNNESISIPVSEPVEFNECYLDIDPWLLGYWIGNGSVGKPSITCHEDDFENIISKIKSIGKYEIGNITKHSESKGVTIYIKNGFIEDLRESGVLYSKVIPTHYMTSSIEQRKQLLAGLMDSDGHIDKSRGRASFGNTVKNISDSVYELASSLGQVCFKREHKAKGFGKIVNFYTVGWTPSFNPCFLERKMKNFKERKLRTYRSVKNIEQIESVPTCCISVSSETKTYLCTTSMIPTHNTVFRRLSKWLPMSGEVRDAFDNDDDRFEEMRNATPKAAFDVEIVK